MIPSPCWYVLVVVAAALGRTHAQACTRPVHPLAGFTGHLEMRSRQLRGTVTVVDACRFDVTGLEVSPGSELQWRGAQGSTAAEVAAGTVVVGAAVSGNISAGSVQGTLLPGVFWDDFAVLTLFSPRTGLTAAVLKLQVGPATTQLTMFDSCQHLTPDVRVRWTVRNDAVEFGLEGLVDPGTAMSFGHNDPAVTNRLMGQADATVVGYDAAGTAAYATDYYLGSYVECHNPDASGAGVDGVCEDASHGGGAALDNVELLYAQRMDGVTLIRYRKPLVAADLWDHDITAHAPQSFIWALSNTGLSNQFRFQTSPSIKYHGVYNWGELPDMVLSTPRFDCAPLAGVMEAQDASSPPSPPADPASILLHAGRVRLTWTLGADDTIAFHVEAFRSSRYLAVAMGTEMKGAYAYVAWFDDDDTGHLNSYTMSGHNARDVQLVSETLSDVEVERSAEGVLSFRFSRPLVSTRAAVRSIDTTSAVPFIWAQGSSWRAGQVSARDEHTSFSGAAVKVDLRTGAAKTVQVDPLWVAHGLCMFVAWGVCIPFAVVAARFMKAYPNGLWLKVHQALVALGFLIMAVGLVLALVADGGEIELHATLGIVAMVLGLINPINGLLRPGKEPHEAKKRKVWEVGHRLVAMAGLVVAIGAQVTGISALEHMGLRGAGDYVAALGAWFAALLVLCVLREVHLCDVARSQRAEGDAAARDAYPSAAKPAYTEMMDMGVHSA